MRATKVESLSAIIHRAYKSANRDEVAIDFGATTQQDILLPLIDDDYHYAQSSFNTIPKLYGMVSIKVGGE